MITMEGSAGRRQTDLCCTGSGSTRRKTRVDTAEVKVMEGTDEKKREELNQRTGSDTSGTVSAKKKQNIFSPSHLLSTTFL